MKSPTEYTWLESYLSKDSLWLENSLNWDSTYDLVFLDYNFYSMLTNSGFLNSHFSVDTLTKFSTIDLLFSNNSVHKELFDFYLWDISTFIYIIFPSLQLLFFSDYQDFNLTLLYYSPELVIALYSYIDTFFLNNKVFNSPVVFFDNFSDLLNLCLSEFIEYFILFFLFCWAIILTTNLFRLFKWSNSVESYFTRIVNYFYTFTKEQRVQFETTLQLFFFYFFLFIYGYSYFWWWSRRISRVFS